MYLGRVIGTCAASTKSAGLDGIRLLVVQPVSETGEDIGRPHVAADAVQAGPGDLVHLVASREAALAMPETFVPIDAAIVGIVDSVDLG